MQLKAGIDRFLFDYVGLSEGAKLVAIEGTTTSNSCCEHLVRRARELGVRSELLVAQEARSQLDRLMRQSDVVLFLDASTRSLGRESLAAMDPEVGDLRASVFRVFDFGDELLSNAFRVPRARLARLNRHLIHLGSRTTSVTVTSPAGTDLHVRLDDRFGWIDSCGQPSAGKPGVLPAAEVASYSEMVEGVLVADGALNTNFGFYGDPRLASRPVRVAFEGSRAVDVRCEDTLLDLFLRRFLAVENADRVGEVGFGTNVGLSEFVPFLSHINERFPALHIGLGSNNQGLDRAGWACPLHLDLILGTCTVEFDGVPILVDGKYIEPEGEVSYASDLPVAHADTF